MNFPYYCNTIYLIINISLASFVSDCMFAGGARTSEDKIIAVRRGTCQV